MKEMSLEEHLGDLRKALIRILVILCVSFIFCNIYGDVIAEFLLSPLREALQKANLTPGSEGGKIVYLGILDKVLGQFQVALWASVVCSSPLWFREIWIFIRPGLYENEVKVIRPFILIGLFLFILGVLFGQYVLFPATFQTLLSFGVADVNAFLGMREYLILSSKVLVLLGIIFQIPNVMLILGYMGLVTKYSLRSMRGHIYVGLAILSAILTPPDVLTMLALWIPIIILFEVGIIAVSLFVHPYLEKIHA